MKIKVIFCYLLQTLGGLAKFGLCTPVWDLPGIRLCQWNVSTFYMIIIMQFLLHLRAEPRIAAEVYSQ